MMGRRQKVKGFSEQWTIWGYGKEVDKRRNRRRAKQRLNRRERRSVRQRGWENEWPRSAIG